MARIVGFIGNRPDLGARALCYEKRALDVRARPVAEGSSTATNPDTMSWGIGFYQGGEVLLKRRPVDDRRLLNMGELTRDVKADVLVGHIRTATIGALRTENTHPFRYRQWLFAQTGTLARFDGMRARVFESLPQFLARDVRGDTDAELVFYLFLSFLHDAGKLDRVDVTPAAARNAVRGALSLLDGLCSESGEDRASLNIVLACSDFVLGVRGSKPMGYQSVAGRAALERIYDGESFSRTKVPHLVSARLAMCAADFDDDILPGGWTALGERSTVTLSHVGDPKVEAL